MGADNLQFKIGMPVNGKGYGLNDDGTLTIVGVASTTNKDLHDEIISPYALQSLKEQIVNRNLHLDHNHDYLGGIGVVDDAYIEDDQLFIVATVLSEFAQGIRERLDLGMNFGLSIAGIPIRSKTNPQLIEDYNLLEVSLTLLPANWDSYGTVESKGYVFGGCLTGVCDYIIKKESGENMAEETPIVEEEELQKLVEETVAEVISGKSEDEETVHVDGEEVSQDELEKIEVPEELSLKQVNDFVDDKINKAFAEKEQALKDEIIEEVRNTIATDFKEEVTSSLKEYIDQSRKAIEEPPEEKGECSEDEETDDLVEKSVKEILRKLDQTRGRKAGKFRSAANKQKVQKKSFLGSAERDQFGRNRKYL